MILGIRDRGLGIGHWQDRCALEPASVPVPQSPVPIVINDGALNPLPNGNFTWGEATQNCTRSIRDLVIDGRLITSAIAIEKNIVRAAKNMDKYRQKLGDKPIIINSWYRPSNVNRSVGGTKWSRHQYGDAIDWVCSHLSPLQIAAKLESQHNDGGYKCYVSQNFTHTDWRGTRARW